MHCAPGRDPCPSTRSNPAPCLALEVVHLNVNHTGITPEGELDLPLIRPLARLCR
jgi:hypothetical protein